MLQEKIKRIDAIDLIRGYFLFVIVIDHLFRFFGFYDLFTGGGQQWVSAAEGFFLVSGMMIGLVRARKLKDKPLFVSVKKVLKRAFQLYFWSILLTFFFVAIAYFHLDNPGLKAGFFTNEPISKLITHTLTLRYVYGWADFLVYYVIYLSLTPIALYLLRAGKWYILLAVNIAVWAFADNLQLAWQLLFFSGTIIGYYLPEIEDWAKNLPRKIKFTALFSIMGLAGLTLIVSLFFNTVIDKLTYHPNVPNFGMNVEYLYNLNTYTLAPWFEKYRLAIGRLGLFYLWFGAFYIIVRRYERIIKKYVGWFFLPYGQNSLYVYIVHAFMVFFINLMIPIDTPNAVNILINTTVLGLIWIMLKTKFLFKIIPR